ncbi:DUF5999 family protein [Streptomyces sp. NPDC014872]|uniref:DUF5999 family protein n=1 Tax=Streptomyces sp. NPDC014872 TaxID=3364926 RepID=UPI0036FCD2DF
MSLTGLVRTGFGHHAPGKVSPLPGRSVATAAMETVALVLDETVVVPATDQDARDLMSRLRVHHRQLGEGARAAASGLVSGRVTDTLRTSGELVGVPVPDDLSKARDHLQSAASAVKDLLVTMGAAGLVCVHQPECPPATAPDFHTAHPVLRCLATGYSRLCNGVVLFEDTGYLKPNGGIGSPSRPLPRVGGESVPA